MAGRISSFYDKVDFYHAGLNEEKRDERKKGWTGNHFRVMVATTS